jgi:hypothetical protein
MTIDLADCVCVRVYVCMSVLDACACRFRFRSKAEGPADFMVCPVLVATPNLLRAASACYKVCWTLLSDDQQLYKLNGASLRILRKRSCYYNYILLVFDDSALNILLVERTALAYYSF